jgi:hypothetical protein
MLATRGCAFYPRWLVALASDRNTDVIALSSNLYFRGKNRKQGLLPENARRSELDIAEVERSATWNH